MRFVKIRDISTCHHFAGLRDPLNALDQSAVAAFVPAKNRGTLHGLAFVAMPILHTILNLLVLTLYVTANIFDIYRTQSSQSLIEKRQVIPSATWGPYVSLGQTTTEYIALS